jgi:hypothetical protein
MTAETIDHNTLSRLVEAGAVRGAHVIGQVGGWGVMIKYGMLERPLSATRSKKIRTFKKLETLVAYLKEIGISRFDVDATQYDPSTVQTYTRPDRAEAMRHAREAIEYDRWFRGEVEKALIEADDPNTQWVSHEEVTASWAVKRAELVKRIEEAQS